MKVEEALRNINAHPERYFKPAKRSGYICPVCGSGSGKKGTGLAKYNDRFKCFGECGTYGDVIDFIKAENNFNDWKDAFKTACELYGIDYKSIEFNSQNKDNTQHTEHTHNTQDTHHTEPKQDKQPLKEDTALNERIKADIAEAQKHLEETDYLNKRGISLETAKRFGLGFIANWKNPKNDKAPVSPRLIIPAGDSYLARDTRDNLTEIQKDYDKIRAGEIHLFNKEALEENKPCFIVEGELDALSIIEVGFNAVALGSCSNKQALINELKNIETPAPIILYLDNDSTGQKTDSFLQGELKSLGINYTSITGLEETYKDANDYLRAFKESFVKFLDDATRKGEKEKEEARLEYISTNNALAYLGDFIDGIRTSVNTPFTATGFKELDSILDGGLYEGLYIIGAISSLGKTTFILQVADQIAKSGQDVLFFSLEQARAELMAKSISRETYLYCKENYINTSNAKSVRGITVASRYNAYNETEKQVINHAIQNYKATAQNLYIYEGVADISVKQIKETVEKHIEATGNKPIVLIDYLQILAPYDDKNRTDKQVTDLNISALKRLSRSLKLSIIGISSFNRDNYNTSVNMSSFKESGAIEYSSDVLIGLQFRGIDDIKQSDSNKKEANEFVDKAKAKNPREVELKLLKNRNGETSKRAYFRYYPVFNTYEEVKEEELDAEEAYKDYRTAKGRY